MPREKKGATRPLARITNPVDFQLSFTGLCTFVPRWDITTHVGVNHATVLLASHDMAEVERLCERVIIMKSGRIEDDDAPGALIARYSQGRPTFVVYGVATDYCVRAAVIGLLTRGHRVALVADAVRAVEPDAESLILTEFARDGVLLTVTDRVVEFAASIS